MLKVFRAITGELTVLFWFLWAALRTYYDYSIPAQFNSKDGRVYPLFEHGSVVYLNYFEHYLLEILMVLAATFLAAFAAIHFYGVKIGAWRMPGITPRSGEDVEGDGS